MRRLFAALLICSLAGCASSDSLRHRGTVIVAGSHSALVMIDDTEIKLVCGKETAPQPPLCVPEDKHHQISVMLAQAYDLEIRIAKIVRALPDGAELPADTYALTAQLSGLIQAILDLLPASQGKTALVQKIGVK